MGFLKKSVYLIGNLMAAVAGAGLLARFVSPELWWPPAIISLGLPLLLLLTGLLAIYLLFRKRWRLAILPVVVTLAAVPLVPRLFALTLFSPPTGEPAITVITNNIRGYKNGAHQAVSAKVAVNFADKRKPDLLLLQEARHSGYSDPWFGEMKEASGLAKRHQLPEKTIATYADELTFVAEKFRPKAFNGFIVTDVQTALGPVRVINAHLESNRISGMVAELGTENSQAELDRAESMLRQYGRAARDRARQAEQIRRYVRESPYPVIVGGDFNDVPASYTYQRILTPRLRDAWAEAGFGLGTTFLGKLPGLRIDFLLVDTALQVNSIETFDNGYSDHLGLEVKLSK